MTIEKINRFCRGKTILKVEQDQGFRKIHIYFSEGYLLILSDMENQCCESRWFGEIDKTELDYIRGATFINVSVSSVDWKDEEYGDVLESAFLIIKTDVWSLQIPSYNRHNGYYGGIDIGAKLMVRKGSTAHNEVFPEPEVPEGAREMTQDEINKLFNVLGSKA